MTSTRPIRFRDYLPEVFGKDESDGDAFFGRFLEMFESLFEELQGEIEGTTDQTSGGIPDLFDPDTTPPPQFGHHPQTEIDYLAYLAGWIGLSLRLEKPIDFNRALFQTAIGLYPRRGTLLGVEALLRAWLKGDLLETEPPLPIVTDLRPVHNDIDPVFQLAPASIDDWKPGEVYGQLGFNTVLGVGPPFLFIVDLITDPLVKELRNPVGLDVFQRAARTLLDAEKPAYTYYQLRVRAHTMQLAPPPGEEQGNEIYAQVGIITLLWDEPWVYNSDC